MKTTAKNWTWLFITVVSFIAFLFATLGIGFKFENRIPASEDLGTLISSNQHLDNYTDATIGFLISGLVISGLTIALVVVKSIIDISKIELKISDNFWDYLYFALIVVASLLLIIGSAIYLGSVLHNAILIKDNVANSVLLFIVYLLPIFFGVAVLSLDWTKKHQSKKKSEKKSQKE